MNPPLRPSTTPRFLRGAELFNRGEFFEAHEVWEELWRTAHGAEKNLYQVLIQCAVALEHLRRGNSVGATRLIDRASRRSTAIPNGLMGISLEGLLAGVKSTIERGLEASQPPTIRIE